MNATWRLMRISQREKVKNEEIKQWMRIDGNNRWQKGNN